MRIVVISDTHNFHESIELPGGDVLVHAGDFSMAGRIREVETFFDWLGGQAHAYKLVIAGNHDWVFELDPEAARSMVPRNVIYLEDSGCEIEGVRFWGSPWQPSFMEWAFNLDTEEERQAKWDLIPSDTDVLVTHGPPFGILDETFDGRQVGCAALGRAVRRTKPAVHLFGHIHEAYGYALDPEGVVETRFVNACVCDFAYRPVNSAVVVDLEW